MAKMSDAKIKANKKWDENNKERKNYINKRSIARNFVKKSATKDDLTELKELIEIREKEF
ncbi:hypothetical protein M5C72_05140 [Companilactobacillus allii]|uniref:Uncharacterized protein n=1 Tax=Companilactobacillus allii TaxID=1847728 RepID=A0A1P8Q3T8_9LACO|nr:hypothetical protein [Companilactobacillus allii]APX72503.1 hypothetical protein BTM29_08055 [Companilactobacillus allii]USQ69606.1 hypothetical protein M5C72_05140 [Companilactobacillus allii]